MGFFSRLFRKRPVPSASDVVTTVRDLGTSRTAGARRKLLAMLRQTPSDYIRRHVIRALGNHIHPDSAAALRVIFANEDLWAFGIHAGAALLNHNEVENLELLFRAVQSRLPDRPIQRGAGDQPVNEAMLAIIPSIERQRHVPFFRLLLSQVLLPHKTGNEWYVNPGLGGVVRLAPHMVEPGDADAIRMLTVLLSPPIPDYNRTVLFILLQLQDPHTVRRVFTLGKATGNGLVYQDAKVNRRLEELLRDCPEVFVDEDLNTILKLPQIGEELLHAEEHDYIERFDRSTFQELARVELARRGSSGSADHATRP